ncbi:MAG: hypothetical protein FGM15_11360 [Chthoniobacterales bacterium]|nr:hypothetical protein [Chthoniobacterales bacterium]
MSRRTSRTTKETHNAKPHASNIMTNPPLPSTSSETVRAQTTRTRLRFSILSAAVLLAVSGPLHAQEDQMPSAFKTVAGYPLLEVFTPPVPNCTGWGAWGDGPFVIANRGDAPAQFPSNFSIPPRSFLAHPGSDRDVAVGWASPITGQVSVQAKVTSADGNGGDGVRWAIIHLSTSGQRKVLAEGEIGRGESRAIPAAAEAAQLAALPVREGDGLLLVINRHGGHQFDSTLLELVVAEHGGAARKWDLVKDVTGNPEAAKPEPGSQGYAGPWHFLASMDDFLASASLDAPRERPGKKLQSWSLATDDTKITLGATAEGQLCIYDLRNTEDGWNWAKEPSVFSFPVPASGKAGRWKFKDATVDKTDGERVTIRFVCEKPELELLSIWSAKPGRGPICHELQVVNRSSAPVALQLPPSMFLDLAGPAEDGALTMWTFHTDGKTPDRKGVYRHVMHGTAARRIDTEPETGLFIPYALFDSGGKRGVYLGVEWSVCSIQARGVGGSKPGSVRVRAGENETFVVTLAPGETFDAPPSFVGAYRGDADDAGNNLRRFLFNHRIPEVVRKDSTYPKIQWNAYGAIGDKPGSWNTVERKFYPFVDDIAPLGFEEVMIDVGWWKGETAAPEPEADPVDWPSGMAKAAEHTKKAGMRFGLYWNKGEDMASPEGRNRRIAHIKRLYNEYGADLWRSDSTAGPVIGSHYAAVKGFYEMLEQLGREIPNFQWENCCCGGRIKDFGAMKYAVKVFNTDTYDETHVRQAFYTSSYMFPPAQLMGCAGSFANTFRPEGPDGMRFAFRTMSLGAPEWFLDAPGGQNGAKPWTEEERAAVKAATETYKTKVRPLVRNADLYHILPRPDGKNWDGIQYYDPATKKGVVCLFKPSPVSDTINIKLRGVDPQTRYRVSFEDGSNPAVEKTGAELANGLDVTLKGAPISELVFFEPANGASAEPAQKGAGGASASEPQYTNPVYAGSMPDPTILRHDGYYYAFGTTGADRTPDGRIFTVLRSKDLVSWEKLGGALVPPSDNKAVLYWAPDVAAANGKFYLYYSMGGLEPEKFELRVAVSSKPEGPYIDTGEKLTDCENNRFTIDAYPFRDDDGKWYLYYARNFTDSTPGAPGEAVHPGTSIVVAPLIDMTRLGDECKVVLRARYDWTLYEANRRMDVYDKTFDWHTIEGPCVIKHDGKYYCFYSGSNWQSDRYGVDYVVADHPMGPFRDQGSRPRVLSGVPGKVRGPGHHSFATSPDGRSIYIVYHAWDAGMKERQLCIDKLVWTPEGPRCEGPTYTAQTAPQ